MKYVNKIIFFVANNLKVVSIFVIIVFVLYTIIAGEYGYISERRLKAQLEEIEQQIEIEKVKRDSIEQIIILLNNSDELIEKTARELYGMKKHNETIISVKKKEK
ncbi:MAG: septum formation initiator family protein [Bacteroidetes bacterium]|nr:septum formation initiator family protein [Bacteroidota bacterium]